MPDIPDTIEPSGTRDTRLISKAIKQRWPVPTEYREALVKRQINIAINPQSSAREATLAFKAILAAEAQNQEDEHHAEGELHRHDHTIRAADDRRGRLALLAARLGSDGVAGQPASGETGGGRSATLDAQNPHGACQNEPGCVCHDCRSGQMDVPPASPET